MNKILFLLLIVCCGSACGKQASSSQQPESQSQAVDVPVFNADSSYHYTDAQVAFGPRVLMSEAHKACGDYLVAQMKRFGAEVHEQTATLSLKDNSPLHIRNIISSFQPEKANRILLFAHWDSRPYADWDPNPDNWLTPIDGANDGAGSCAVLMEIARQISLQAPEVGVDMIFFDAEDWGEPEFDPGNKRYADYCMGSTYWAQNPHKPGYQARYGILLDMVSGPGATFYHEYLSRRVAPTVLRKVWDTAHFLGFSAHFINENIGAIEDDHVPVVQYLRIPCIDIIQYHPGTEKGFGDFWHTLEDSMHNISKDTQYAVGQTLLHVLYNEK